jgi:rsbT co-antagonist protein RsbR
MQLQRRLAELEARLIRYEALLAQFPDGALLLFDDELRYTLADGTALAPLGLSKDSLEGRTVREALPPEHWAAIEQRYRAALDGQSTTEEAHYGDRIFEMRTQPLYAQDGQLLGGMVVAMDITARKAAEHALQEVTRRLAAIKEDMPEAFFRLDHDWRFAYVNRHAEPLLERHASDLLGRSIWEEFPDAVGTPFEQHYRTAMQTQQPVTFEQFYPPLERWFDVHAVPSPDSLSVYFHDVSDRKRAELAAREQAELFQTVIDQMSDGVILADPDGRFRIFNQASQRIFGPNRDTAGAAWAEHYGMFRPDQQTRFPTEELPLAQALRGQESRDVEVFVRHPGAPDGLWITVNGRPLFDRAGQITGGLVVCRDETERKRAAAERAHLQETLIEMQTATLRELSTPLIPITDQVVVMPLVGTVDARRADQVLETLLEGITRNQAQVAIVDITGVPVVDTHVANGLLRIAQSARLLGTSVILTGIRPEVAQTLVGLGVGMEGIITRSTLQSGIAYALGKAQST